MNTEITNALKATSDTAQYDNSAKRLLGNKYILAQILVYTVDEFKGMQPMDVVPLIEGEPKIGIVPVEPGLTNERQGDKIIGLNTENTEEKEGFITYGIEIFENEYHITSEEKGEAILSNEQQKQLDEIINKMHN